MKNKISTLFGKMVKKRNTIFLIMCLMVHFAYFSVFFIMKAIPLCLINAISSVFYVLFLIFSKDREKSEKASVCAYFEIIIFSTLCELFTRNTFGFIYFVIGMIPVIFYLSPSYGNKRFLFQIIGVISALMIHHTHFIIPDSFFSDLYSELLPYSNVFNFVNLMITLFTVLYTSFFYELELDMIKKELDYNSTHDLLTGLYNRRFLYDSIIRTDEERFSVVLIDIDNFKKINDRFGHNTGDEVLRSLSSCIKEIAGGKELSPVRWGGEEFIICCKNTDIDSAYGYAESIRQMIFEKIILPDNTHITVTVGLSYGTCSDFDSIVKKADEYLYIGKNNGKNCIVWHKNENEFLCKHKPSQTT